MFEFIFVFVFQPRKLPSLRDKYSKIKTTLRQTLCAEKNESKKTGGGPCKNKIVLTEAMQELAELIALSAHGLEPLPGEEDASDDDEQNTAVNKQQRQDCESDFEEPEYLDDVNCFQTNDGETSLEFKSNVVISTDGVILSRSTIDLASNELTLPTNQTQLVSFEHLLPSSSEINALAPSGVGDPIVECEDSNETGIGKWDKVNPAALRNSVNKALKRTIVDR